MCLYEVNLVEVHWKDVFLFQASSIDFASWVPWIEHLSIAVTCRILFLLWS